MSGDAYGSCHESPIQRLNREATLIDDREQYSQHLGTLNDNIGQQDASMHDSALFIADDICFITDETGEGFPADSS